MNLPAFFLNAVVCTTAAHDNCMPPQFVWMAPKFLNDDARAQQCNARAQGLNKAQEDKTIFYRCDAQRGA
ncbi:hypothetical protein [Pseudomonas eucalypticola]|uniref:Uncharacterized protein n=1 Tax=Pseudomonas eucalypticola TaxID=2599595 RepID=A0A7D5H4Q8_9PSED|nr:hypothetical protein [Pseudomonas eucalypticola]QKZ05542.1 hypothetical protein HWQ56_17770 [Pseudomonas eucalypticola]